MKKLTMKNIALGLALAGYAASSAYAVEATTNQLIRGSAPVLSSPAVGASASDLAEIKVFRGANELTAGETIAINDKIVITFKYTDSNDDAIGKNAGSFFGFTRTEAVSNDVFGFTMTLVDNVNGAADIPVTLADLATKTDPSGATAGVYEYIVPVVAAGRDINIVLGAASQFGLPWHGNRTAGDIGSLANVTVPPTPPTGPVANDTIKVNIYQSSQVNASTGVPNGFEATEVPLNTSGAITLGDKLFAVTYNDIDGTSGYTSATDTIFAVGTVPNTVKEYKWTLVGGNSDALGTTASTTDVVIDGQVSQTLQLPANNTLSGWMTTVPSSGMEAGIQGFKVKVEAVFN